MEICIRMVLTFSITLMMLNENHIRQVYGLQLPDLYLDPKDPIFNSTLCAPISKTIYVRKGDTMNVVCLNSDLNNAVRKEESSPFGYTYNLLVTTDKKLFQKRRKQSIKGDRKASLVHICRQHQQIVKNQHGFFREAVDKYHIQFSPWRTAQGPEFKAGKVYYFYTTSGGTEEGLKNEIGPASTRHMYFKVVLCEAGNPCRGRNRVGRCVPRENSARKQRFSDDEETSKANNNKNRPLLIGAMTVGCFVAGFLIASLIYLATYYCVEKKIVETNKQKSGISLCLSPPLGSSEHSELL